MNEYDKADRYLIKRDPPGFFRWLLRRRDVSFHAWIDTRRHALPDQGDLTNDLVAAFRVAGGFEALCVELQAASEGGSAPRLLLGYVPRLLTEPAAPGSLVLRAAGGAVVVEYIEVFYTSKRRHSALGYVAPAEYEQPRRP